VAQRLHFTPPSWLSASLVSFAVAFVLTLPLRGSVRTAAS